MLASRRVGRCAACAELCGGLQHPLAAAGDRPSRPRRAFLRLVGGVRMPRLLAARRAATDKGDGAGQDTAAPAAAQSHVTVTCCARMNSAGPTNCAFLSSCVLINRCITSRLAVHCEFQAARGRSAARLCSDFVISSQIQLGLHLLRLAHFRLQSRGVRVRTAS